MSKFQKIENALQLALNEIKGDIKSSPVKPEFKAELPYHSRSTSRNKVVDIRIQRINGYDVSWETVGDRKTPVLKTDKFWIQYPTKPDDIELPKGTVRASYNAKKRCVEFFKKGSEQPIKAKYDQRYDGLPYPRFMQGLESIEEILDIDLETGEITTELKINVLDEYSHWLLRLQEFEIQSKQRGIAKEVIDLKMKRYIKNLKATRGVDILDPRNKVPPKLMEDILFVKRKQATQIR